MDGSQKYAYERLRLSSPGRRKLYAAVAGLSLFCALAPVAAATQHVLTSVGEIRRLPAGAAAGGIPVRLEGVVTAVSGWRNSFFLQDASGGISVDSDDPTAARAGDKIQLTGRTGAGMFAAVVLSRQVNVLGRGKLPPAPLFTYSNLMGGGEDSDSITVRGVLRSAKIEPLWAQKVLALKVQDDSGPISLLVRNYGAKDAQRLVDAVVHVRGVCSTSFNEKHQFTGMAMFVTDMSDVVMEQPAAIDPYAASPTRVREVMQFKPGARFTHRVLIAGTLTYQDLGHSLYLQDGEDGILVESNLNISLPLGARVEAVGFPAPGAYSPALQEAIFRMVRSGKPIVPAFVHAADFLRGESFLDAPYDSQLVTLTGELVETSVRINDGAWLLRDGDRHFLATLSNLPQLKRLPAIPDGSTVSATGVFSVQVDEDRKPTSFRVLMRDGSDLVVVRKASWWTSAHSLEVLAVLLVVTFGTSFWSITLRVRVRQQTSMLRKSEERFREQARCDSLTGLASRSFLNEQLDEAIRGAPGKETSIGLLMVDLDHFKQVNDTFGHHAGDELLVVVAKRIRHSVRQSDVVARMGGDEFVVLLKEIGHPPNAELVGAKVVAAVSANAQIAGRPMTVSGSVGLCLYPEGGLDSETLLRNVDAAMYAAKAAGRNNFRVYQPGREPSPGTAHG